ncbi:hypothetical protein LH51_08620 [Nitrincola sp. A-D6]|nr:hypothetical protein LH51_08620 [Nitrincola sp. A-D6]
MLNLNIKDVNTVARSLTFNGTFTKSGKSRSIGLSQSGLTIINGRVERDALGVDGALFPALTKDSFQHYWKHMREFIGMQDDKEFVFHAVRHTVATRLIDGTGVANKPMPIAIVKEWLGHSTIATTMKYVHVSADHLKGWVD